MTTIHADSALLCQRGCSTSSPSGRVSGMSGQRNLLMLGSDLWGDLSGIDRRRHGHAGLPPARLCSKDPIRSLSVSKAVGLADGADAHLTVDEIPPGVESLAIEF